MTPHKNLLLTTILLLLGLASCTGTNGEPVPETDQVMLQLKWTHGAQFAGIYAAVEQGYYAEEHIEIEMIPNNIDGVIVDPMSSVIDGVADFGISDGTSIVRARMNGEGITGIAALFQINPTAYFSLEESGIESPADMKGKTVAYSEADLLFPTLLKSAGLTLDDVIYYPLTFDYTPLLEGEVDVWTGYLTNQVQTLRDEGYDLNVALAYDYGAFIYSDVLMTTDALIDENPDLVERFVRATLRGWAYVLDHPEESFEIIHSFDPDPIVAHLKSELEATLPLIDSGSVPIGTMEDLVWETTLEIMLDAGLIEELPDAEQFFTNQFVAPNP